MRLCGSLGVRPEALLAGLCWRPTRIQEGELAGDLRRAYESSLGELAASPLGGGNESGHELQDVLVAIRRLPGFEEFGTGECLEDLIAATEPGLPLLYVNPTSVGTGSACVIASLWSVSDLATAILMTRLYEDMFGNGLRPPEALCRAQLWLRDLREEEKMDFVRRHPPLDAEVQRRAERGERVGISTAAADGWLRPGRPFSHPYFWAPFVAIGA